LELRALNDVECGVGESPVYDDRRNALWYCDIVGKTLYCADLAGGSTKSWDFATEVPSLGLCQSGRIVLALRHEVGLFDPQDGSFTRVAEVEADQGAATRLNDGKVGPDGAFWVGTMDDRGAKEKLPLGSLYRVTADGKVARKVEGLMTANGLAWSPDGRAMYHSDSRGPWIDRWDFDPATGDISARRRMAVLDDNIGRPDGGATDAEGCYWSAGVSAARLNRFSPEGKLLESHPVPVASPTMPCFGGPGLRTLYLTSLRAGRAPELLADYPLSGIVLFGRSLVAGSPVSRFADVVTAGTGATTAPQS
jgi:sugar lactone lactonase YvrE